MVCVPGGRGDSGTWQGPQFCLQVIARKCQGGRIQKFVVSLGASPYTDDIRDDVVTQADVWEGSNPCNRGGQRCVYDRERAKVEEPFRILLALVARPGE